MKSGSLIKGFTSHGLAFTDDTEIPADVVVFATGYESDMKLAVSKLIDPEVADKLDECWLLDEEGNPRGSWKPIGRKYFAPCRGRNLMAVTVGNLLTKIDPNIWYCPGDIGTSRFFSRFVALQIKAEVEGTPFVPYDKRL